MFIRKQKENVMYHDMYIYMTSLNVMLVGYGIELKCFRQTCYSAHLNRGILQRYDLALNMNA